MNINILRFPLGKFLMAALLLGTAFCANAMDVVTLHSGQIKRGEIYHRDDDGSLMMNLTNRTKWYIPYDEIASLTNDGLPFRYENAGGSEMEFDITVYAGYEQVMPTSLTIDGDKAKIYTSSPGVVAGFGINIPLKHNLVLIPGIELAYNKSRHNDTFKIDGVEAEYDGDLDGWLNFRIPVQIGYELAMTKDMKLLVHTGPIIETYVGYKYGYDGGDSGMAFDQSYEVFWGYDYDAGNGYGDSVYGSWSYNRVNVDWRFGVRANYRRLSLGLAFTAGMTNRLRERMDGPCKASMRQNSFQLTLGWAL